MSQNISSKNQDNYLSIKKIQETKRKMVLSFMKYLETHDIKNKKNISRLIQDFDELNYKRFSESGKMKGGTTKYWILRFYSDRLP